MRKGSKRRRKGASQYFLLSRYDRPKDRPKKKKKQRMVFTPEQMRVLIYQGLGRNDEEETADRSNDEEGLRNIDFKPESPNAASPQVLSEELEELDLDLRANDNLGHQSGKLRLLKQVAMAAAVGCRPSLFINFYYGYEQHGGLAYVLVFVLSMFFVAVPIAIMELAVGQYSSLPPIKMFSRLSKSSTATGILIVMYRLLITFKEVLDARGIYGVIETISEDPERTWSRICSVDAQCFYLRLNEEGAKEILGHTYTPGQPNSTSENLVWKLLAQNSFTMVSAPQIHELTMKKYDFRYFIAVTLLLVLAGIICSIGMHCLAWFSLSVIVVPMCTHFAQFVKCVVEQSEVMSNMIKFEQEHLLRLQTFLHAMSLSFQIFSVGNGSWLILGTISPYSSSILAPVLITAIAIVIILCVSTLGAVPAYSALYVLRAKDDPMRELLSDISVSNLFEIVYYRITMIPPKELAILALLVSSTTLLPYMILTLELVVQTVYRIVPVLYRLQASAIRMCVINSLLCFTVVIFMEYNKEYFRITLNSHTKVTAQMSILIMEVVMLAHVYRDSRILINLRAMAAERTILKHSLSFYLMKTLGYVWRYFCPTVITICLVYEVFTENTAKEGWCSLLTLTKKSMLKCLCLFLQLFLIFNEITWSKVKRLPVWSLFVPNNRWGAANLDERRKANRLERAARIYR